MKKFQVALFKLERFSTIVEIEAENNLKAIAMAQDVLALGLVKWEGAVVQDEGVADIVEVSR